MPAEAAAGRSVLDDRRRAPGDHDEMGVTEIYASDVVGVWADYSVSAVKGVPAVQHGQGRASRLHHKYPERERSSRARRSSRRSSCQPEAAAGRSVLDAVAARLHHKYPERERAPESARESVDHAQLTPLAVERKEVEPPHGESSQRFVERHARDLDRARSVGVAPRSALSSCRAPLDSAPIESACGERHKAVLLTHRCVDLDSVWPRLQQLLKGCWARLD
eukprot:CAMPEP_0202801908 /NCGR_PEP_ID=MMETSP1388-20130828/102375_1 /ASSEMBLY_ACC=CAM_ASM_000864 /TAXON_ID=37098 /ORGANISM="Isochrysis sp, Strain CCMP1244" /LENGTH=220 /DNA_ID=CAMNT_0049471899 /DNA_START=267 /DNA_END=931 /DNA_ORIENTATION=-